MRAEYRIQLRVFPALGSFSVMGEKIILNWSIELAYKKPRENPLSSVIILPQFRNSVKNCSAISCDDYPIMEMYFISRETEGGKCRGMF